MRISWNWIHGRSDLGSLLSGNVPENTATTWFWYAGLAATLVITILITRIATKALMSNLEESATDA